MKKVLFYGCIAAALVLALTMAGCDSSGGGSDTRAGTVSVDTGLPGAGGLDTLPGAFPEGDEATVFTAVKNLIGQAQSARRYISGFPEGTPSGARAAGFPSSTNSSESDSYNYENYKIEGKPISVTGYRISSKSQTYREEIGPGPNKNDSDSSSYDSKWATIYDIQTIGSIQLNGKVVDEEKYSRKTTYTTVTDKDHYHMKVEGSSSSTSKEAFSISNGTHSLKYSIEYSGSRSGTDEMDVPSLPSSEPDTSPKYPTEEFFNDYYKTHRIKLTVWDKDNAEKMTRDSNAANNTLADKLWIYDNLVDSSGGGFTPVTDITGVPESGAVGVLTVTGAVVPSNATYKTIVWSIKDAGTTNATLAGSTLTTTAVGTVVVTGTIPNGGSGGGTFMKDFTIPITPPATLAAVIITGTQGAALTSQTITVTLPTGVTFKAMTAGTNVTTYFNVPAGVTVTSPAIAEAVNMATFAVTGTPTAPSSSNIIVTIPVTALNGAAGAIFNVPSTDAKWNIIATVAPTPPTLSTAVATKTNEIVLTFTSALAGTTASPAAFTLSGSTGASPSTATVSGSTVTIGLTGTALSSSSSFTVTYAANGTTNLTSANGAVVNFTSSTVNVTGLVAPVFTVESVPTNLSIKLRFDKPLATFTPSGTNGFMVTGNTTTVTVSSVSIVDTSSITLILTGGPLTTADTSTVVKYSTPGGAAELVGTNGIKVANETTGKTVTGIATSLVAPALVSTTPIKKTSNTTITVEFDKPLASVIAAGTGFAVTPNSGTITVSAASLSADKKTVTLTVGDLNSTTSATLTYTATSGTIVGENGVAVANFTTQTVTY